MPTRSGPSALQKRIPEHDSVLPKSRAAISIAEFSKQVQLNVERHTPRGPHSRYDHLPVDNDLRMIILNRLEVANNALVTGNSYSANVIEFRCEFDDWTRSI